MPTYEFRCPGCTARRDVHASMREADGLALVCVDCGGTMTKGFGGAGLVLVTSSSSGPVSGARRRGRPAVTCTDGAVRLSRPNPFRAELASADTGERR